MPQGFVALLPKRVKLGFGHLRLLRVLNLRLSAVVVSNLLFLTADEAASISGNRAARGKIAPRLPVSKIEKEVRPVVSIFETGECGLAA